LRVAGQILADAAGSYGFAVDAGGAGDYARVIVDGTVVAGTWPSTQPTGPLALSPGWHDVALDYSNNDGVVAVTVTVTRDGVPFEPTVRPVATTQLAGALANPVNLVDGGIATTTFAVSAPDGAIVDYADVGLYVTGSTPR